jgi:5-methylcytosine-specific restriction endonuclease McrA
MEPTPGRKHLIYKLRGQTLVERSYDITPALLNTILKQLSIQFSQEQSRDVIRLLECKQTNGSLVCAYCSAPATREDHFRALIKDGEPSGFVNDAVNCVPSCKKCHDKKGLKEFELWKPELALEPRWQAYTDYHRDNAQKLRINHTEFCKKRKEYLEITEEFSKKFIEAINPHI